MRQTLVSSTSSMNFFTGGKTVEQKPKKMSAEAKAMNQAIKEHEYLIIGNTLTFSEYDGRKKEIIGVIKEFELHKDLTPKSLILKLTYYREDRNKVGKEMHLKYLPMKNKKKFSWVIVKITNGGEKASFNKRYQIAQAA